MQFLRHGHCSHSPAICFCTAGKPSDLDLPRFTMPIVIGTAVAYVAQIDIQTSAVTVIVAQDRRFRKETVKRIVI